MKTVIRVLATLLIGTQAAFAAEVTNKDANTAVLVIVEDGSKVELAVSAGATEAICPSGCFLTTPSGDRIGLQGDENIEIINGEAVVR